MIDRLRRIADPAIVLLSVAYVALAVSSAWQRPLVLAILLLPPPLLLGLRIGNARRAAALAASGLVLGPVTEILCVASGLWTYAETGGLPLVPAWILPLWAGFPAALELVAKIVIVDPPHHSFRPRRLLLSLLGLDLEILLFATLGSSTLQTLAAVAPLAVIVLVLGRGPALVAFVAGALLGPLCESLPIASGSWRYALPEWLGMPLWLPLGYAVFSSLLSIAAEEVASLAATVAGKPYSGISTWMSGGMRK